MEGIDGAIVKKAIKLARKTQPEIAAAINISREHLNRMLNNTIPPEYVELIRKAGVKIDEVIKSDTRHVANKSGQVNGLPLIPLQAFAGISTDEDYAVTFAAIQERYVIPLFEGKQVDFLIYVRGTSMYPRYSTGDVVACKFIRERLYIQWNKVYVIDTISQGVMLKRLKKSGKAGYITFRSDNSEYEDFDVPENDIRNLALVIGLIRLE